MANEQDKIKQAQQEVDEVVDLMKVNVDKVLDRDQKLSELDERADALKFGAQQFENTASGIESKYWWMNKKWQIIIGCLVAAIFAIILILIFSN